MLSIRVLVASRVRLYREELARVLPGSPELTLVGSAASAEEAIKRTQEPGVDVVLLDMAMSGAFLVAKEVVRRRGKIVALGMPESEAQVLSCAQLGISAYVTCDGSVEDVVAAIRAAARGEAHCSPKVAGSLFRRLHVMSTEPPLRSANVALTSREGQILKLVQEGMSNKMIARALGIELTTVKNHVHSIFVKLRVRRRADAICQLYRLDAEKGAAVSGGAAV
jgi:two-component system, NarL family, nitrate/nitrite response regulator NarL